MKLSRLFLESVHKVYHRTGSIHSIRNIVNNTRWIDSGGGGGYQNRICAASDLEASIEWRFGNYILEILADFANPPQSSECRVFGDVPHKFTRFGVDFNSSGPADIIWFPIDQLDDFIKHGHTKYDRKVLDKVISGKAGIGLLGSWIKDFKHGDWPAAKQLLKRIAPKLIPNPDVTKRIITRQMQDLNAIKRGISPGEVQVANRRELYSTIVAIIDNLSKDDVLKNPIIIPPDDHMNYEGGDVLTNDHHRFHIGIKYLNNMRYWYLSPSGQISKSWTDSTEHVPHINLQQVTKSRIQSHTK